MTKNIFPLNYELLTIIIDYENALMNAQQVVFPERKLQCCWFRYTQNCYRFLNAQGGKTGV